MLTKNINFKNFKLKKKNKKINFIFNNLVKEKNTVLESLRASYKNSYNKKIILKFKKYSEIRIIGIGGSILGTESIYAFLKHKIKKKISFINNLQSKIKPFDTKKKYVNLIVSNQETHLKRYQIQMLLSKIKIKIFSLLRIKKVIYIYLLKS